VWWRGSVRWRRRAPPCPRWLLPGVIAACDWFTFWRFDQHTKQGQRGLVALSAPGELHASGSAAGPIPRGLGGPTQGVDVLLPQASLGLIVGCEISRHGHISQRSVTAPQMLQ